MSTVTVDVTADVATLWLDDARRGNPVDHVSVVDLARAVRTARDAGVAVVVLRARGRFFSVGGDVAGFGAAEDPGAYIDDLAEALHRTVAELISMDAVVVSVVHGPAAGAGVPLAAAADIVLAGASASFTLAYTKIGLSPDGGSTLLTATLGLHRSLGMALLNPTLTAEQAHAAGLVFSVHPDDELDAAVDAVVATLAAGSRSAQAAAKHLMRRQAVPAPESAMRRETVSIRRQAASGDGREGVRAFLEKRRPTFGGDVQTPQS